MGLEEHVAAQPQPSAVSARHEQVSVAGPLVIDCDRCTVRGVGCDDCVISVLLGGPPTDVPFDATERHALDVLADAGLVPPLRMVEPLETRHPG